MTSSIRSPVFHCLKRNGPVPTGWRANGVLLQPLPEWADDFAQAVDRFQVKRGREPVTAGDALRVLKRLAA